MKWQDQPATIATAPAAPCPCDRAVPAVPISRRLVSMMNDPLWPSCPSAFVALASVARTIGETIELRQVFARVADAAHSVLPFERMRVVLTEGDQLRMYATEQDGRPGWEDGKLVPVTDISPQFWHEFVVERLDVQRQLDPSFRWDRETIEAGHR